MEILALASMVGGATARPAAKLRTGPSSSAIATKMTITTMVPYHHRSRHHTHSDICTQPPAPAATPQDLDALWVVPAEPTSMAPTLVLMGITTAVMSLAALAVAMINPKHAMSEGYQTYQLPATRRSMGRVYGDWNTKTTYLRGGANVYAGHAHLGSMGGALHPLVQPRHKIFPHR